MGILEVHNEFHFSGILARFGLQCPSRVIITLRKDLLELDPATANEVVEGHGVAVPHANTDLTKAFNEGDDSLLLEDWMFSSISAGPGAEFGCGILQADVGVLPRYPLRVLQFAASHNSDIKKLSLDPVSCRHEQKASLVFGRKRGYSGWGNGDGIEKLVGLAKVLYELLQFIGSYIM